MEKYSKAVSEMYSQFKQREVHPMEKYIGRFVRHRYGILEVVGYAVRPDGSFCLIVDASQTDGWSALALEPFDVVFKECKRYWYVSINDLID